MFVCEKERWYIITKGKKKKKGTGMSPSASKALVYDVPQDIRSASVKEEKRKRFKPRESQSSLPAVSCALWGFKRRRREGCETEKAWAQKIAYYAGCEWVMKPWQMPFPCTSQFRAENKWLRRTSSRRSPLRDLACKRVSCSHPVSSFLY